MVQINFGQREVSCKVVFYGPGMSGKTTNLEIIHKKAPKEAVGEMVSIATETDRTLYFDFLPLDLGQVAGMRTKFQLYTVPGQIYYNATRKLVLQGVDGVIFVADSSPDKMPENLESLQNLRDNLAEMNLTIDDVPLVLQYNKRDLPGAMSIADLNAQMNPMNAPVFEGVAREGKGVFATLKEISRLVIEKLNKDHAPAANRRRTNSSLPGTTSTQVRPSAPTPAPVQQPSTSATPMGGSRTPHRPAAVAAPPVLPPSPRSTFPVPAAQPTSAHGALAQTPAPAPSDNPRDKHLAKAKPPALDNLRQAPARLDLGTTDPNLKRYQQTQQPGGGGALRSMLTVLLGLIIVVIVLAILVVFVPAVRALLPQDIQRMFLQPAAATPAPAAAVAAPVAPTAPAVAPAGPKPAASAPTAVAPTTAPATPAETPAATVIPVPAAPPAPALPATPPAEGANGK